MVAKSGTLWKHPRLLSSKVGRLGEILLKWTFRCEVCGLERKGHCKVSQKAPTKNRMYGSLGRSNDSPSRTDLPVRRTGVTSNYST